MSRRTRSALLGRLALGALLALLLAGMLLRVLLPGAPSSRWSSRSRQPEGWLAAFLLLEGLGREPARFTGAYARLPRAGGLLILPEEPHLAEHLAPQDERDSRRDDAPPGPTWYDPRHPRHLGRFVRTGGVLFVPASPDACRLVAAALELEPDALPRGTEGASGEVRLESGEVLRLDPPRRLAPTPASDPDAIDSPWSAWARDGEGEPVVLARPFEDGRLVFVPDGGWFTNARIAAEDHALLLVRVIEQAYAGGPLLFDESAVGGFRPQGPLALAFGPRLLGWTLHVLLALALLLWSGATPRAFPRDPEPIETAGALTRARAEASLFARAGRYALLADALRDGVLSRLARRGPRSARDAEERRRWLDEALAGRGIALDERARAALLGPPPEDATGLERLAATLVDLESRLTPRLDPTERADRAAPRTRRRRTA